MVLCRGTSHSGAGLAAPAADERPVTAGEVVATANHHRPRPRGLVAGATADQRIDTRAWLSKPPITSDETPSAVLLLPPTTIDAMPVALFQVPAATALPLPEAVLLPLVNPIHEFGPDPVPSFSMTPSFDASVITIVVVAGTK